MLLSFRSAISNIAPEPGTYFPATPASNYLSRTVRVINPTWWSSILKTWNLPAEAKKSNRFTPVLIVQ